MKGNERALISKDMNEITSSKRIIMPMTILPVILTVFLPLLILAGAKFMERDPSIMERMEPLLTKLPSEYSEFTPPQLLIRVALDLMYPSFFLVIPIMCSGVIGASSFVGEKERKTLESLLYTPISMVQLLRAKILGIFVPTFIITLASFVVFCIIFNIGGLIYFGNFILPSLQWLIIIFWITPAISLFSLTFTVMISARSKTFQEALQVSGLLVIPVMLVLVTQMIGVLLISNSVMFIVGLVLYIISLILINRIAAKFVPEKLI